MSGFEVIGVVLAVYPVVLNACQLYKATRSGEAIEKLIRRLDIEQFLFDDFVSRLLGPDVGESQLLRLKTSTDLGSWKENDLQAKLEQRHGFVKTKHIISLINDLNELLQSIQRDLPGVARSFVCIIAFFRRESEANLMLWNRRSSIPNFDLPSATPETASRIHLRVHNCHS
jgi:hypothetical protein